MVKEIQVNSLERNQLINITSQVKKIVSDSKVKNGLCVVYCPHTTAGIMVNENADPAVASDLLRALEALVPKIDFEHSEGNSDAHLKSALVGPEKTFIINDGELVLGVWQAIYLFEADGPRERKVIVKCIGE